jgi:chemotaxis protein methyltransferase CheR
MEELTNITDEELRRVIQTVRTIDDVDLGQFQSVILRHRICRFAAGQGYESASALVSKLISDRPLIHTFLQKIAVPTTEMFRDSEFWTELDDIITGPLSAERFIKIWVPDVYGDDELNTLLVILSRNNLMHKATIYATSQTQMAIDESRESHIDHKKFEISEANFKRFDSDDTLSAYLERQEKYYKFSPQLLDKVIFLKQCVSKDPPPDKGFNLILFRNRSIYYNATVRRTAIEKIVQSLIPGGYIALGSGETLDGNDTQATLAQVSKNEKIYRKKQ